MLNLNCDPPVCASEKETMETQVQVGGAPLPEPQSTPSQPPPPSAQMVCGSCRRLLKYPQGAKHVQCSCCQTVNFVLEAHQVGQVKCGSCTTLLMYPYGAPSVRCSSCSFVTEVGKRPRFGSMKIEKFRNYCKGEWQKQALIKEHNMRPPWSVQQGQPPCSSNSVH